MLESKNLGFGKVHWGLGMARGRAMSARCGTLLGTASFLALILAGPSAMAQCAPDPATDGDTVTCSGVDTDGFSAPFGVDQLNVIVESGTSVSTSIGVGAITLFGNDNTVRNDGSIAGALSGAGLAVDFGETFRLDNGGTITAEDGEGVSIDSVNDVIVVNEADGVIRSENGTSALAISHLSGTSTDRVTNDGVIESLAGDGIDIETIGVGIDAFIQNNGRITAAENGINAFEVGSSGGGAILFSIENTGLIEAGAGSFGVRIDGLEGTARAVNSGEIRAGNGILSGLGVTDILNTATGRIVTTTENGFGVRVSNVFNDAQITIVNEGEITSSASGVDLISAEGETVSITNRGALSADGEDARGVSVPFGFAQNITFLNEGDITIPNGEAVVLGSLDTIDFDNTGNISGVIELSNISSTGLIEFANAGTISGQLTIDGDRANIINTGSILGGVVDGTLDGGSLLGTTTVFNSGTIDTMTLGIGNDTVTLAPTGQFLGLVDGGAGSDLLIVDTDDFARTLEGDLFTEFEQFEKRGAAPVTLTGELEFQIGAGEILVSVLEGELILAPDSRLNAGGIAGGGRVDIAEGARLSGSGSINGDVFVSGVFNPSAEPAPISIEGTFNMNPSGTYEFTFDGSNRDFLTVSEEVNLAGGINVIVPTTVVGDFTRLIIQAGENSDIVGEFDRVTTVGNSRVRLEPRFTNLFGVENQQFIRISSLGPVETLEAPIPTLSAASRMGYMTTRGQHEAVFNRANRIAINNPATAYQPFDGLLNDYDFEGSLGFASPLLMFASAGVNAAPSSGDDYSNPFFNVDPKQRTSSGPRWTTYASLSAGFGKYGNLGAQSGFDYRDAHMALGIDYFITGSTYVGVALGHSQIRSDIRPGNPDVLPDGGDLDSDSVGLTFYAAHVNPKGFYVNGAMSYFRNFYSHARTAVPGLGEEGQTFANFGGNEFGFSLLGGYDVGDETGSFGVYAGGSLANATVGDYTESGLEGVGLFNLDGEGLFIVDEQNTDFYSVKAGVRKSWRFEKFAHTFVPQVRGGARVEFQEKGEVVQTVFSLGRGSAIPVTIDATDRGIFELGGSILTTFGNYAALGAAYDAEIGMGGYDQVSHKFGIFWRARL